MHPLRDSHKAAPRPEPQYVTLSPDGSPGAPVCTVSETLLTKFDALVFCCVADCAPRTLVRPVAEFMNCSLPFMLCGCKSLPTSFRVVQQYVTLSPDRCPSTPVCIVLERCCIR